MDSKAKVLRLIGPTIREHLSILFLLASFVLFISIIEIIIGKHPSIKWDWGLYHTFALLIIVICFSIQIFTRLSYLKVRGTAGLVIIWGEIREEYINLERLTGFFLIYLSIPLFIIQFSIFKQLMPDINPFRCDEILMKIDYVLHLGHHPWALIQPFLGYADITCSIDILYMLWFPIMFGIMLWMAWSGDRRLRLQFFISFITLWIIIGTVLATIFSSAGPCYYEKVTSLKSPYIDLMAYLNKVDQVHNLFAVFNQNGLWNAHSQEVYLPFGGISAMASMHVAGSTLFAILAWEEGPFWGLLLTAYALITLIGSVHLGWHYAIDGYVAILLTLMVWKVADRALIILGWKTSELGA
jgi:hypothetical protein